MDARTLDYYRTHAAELAGRYEAVISSVARYFPLAFVGGSRVLDVGAGSGRDLAALLAAGFDGHGVEPTDEFRYAALQRHLTRLYQDALRSIAAAIRSGPVTFAGGALESGRVFQFDGQSRSVLMSADLWRELSLLGHWIVDAVIVRWAALTERFARRQSISSGEVLPLLLARPDPDRVTAVARGIYLAAHADRCVWSGRRLGARNFVVDHAIPFSLWGNNDLWNLLPADADINARKSDKLTALPWNLTFGTRRRARGPNLPHRPPSGCFQQARTGATDPKASLGIFRASDRSTPVNGRSPNDV